MVKRIEELALSGRLGADVLGVRPRLAIAQTWRMAAVLAGSDLSGDVLLRICYPALQASHRADDDGSGCLPANRGWKET